MNAYTPEQKNVINTFLNEHESNHYYDIDRDGLLIMRDLTLESACWACFGMEGKQLVDYLDVVTTYNIPHAAQ